MARRLGRRKEPSREKYVLHGQNQVDSGIFDEKTMIYLSKFYNKGIVGKLGYPIARGKEADVYIAEPGASKAVKGMDRVILKFFRIETSSFNKMQDYIIGDRRFTKKATRKSKLGVITEWCRKEFINLSAAAKAGINAPVPLMFNGSILAMTFIGDGTKPSPQLKDIDLPDPESVLDLILKDVRLLYKNKLVHADLSEYNILIKDGKPYIIDMGQAVDAQHPKAGEFLVRDVKNMLNYFERRYGVKRVLESEMKIVKGSKN